MKRAIPIILCSVLLFCSAGPAFAVEDQFIVSQNVAGDDLVAPSVPVNLTATVASMDQIDLSWDASTDNIAVTGYQVFRDGIQIATTAAIMYSDVGLSAATSYDYNVTAFDNAGNISARSATTTATTDAVPTTAPSEGGNPPVRATPILSDLTIIVDEYSAKLSWETSIPTRSVIDWGLTLEYEIASLSERSLLSEHATRLTGLSPGTRYLFRITGRDRSGTETVLFEGAFTTRPLPDTTAPQNVSGLTGVADRKDVVLTWRNPEDRDFSKVRIVRRATGYPSDPFDGVVVYEGSREEYRDLGAFGASPGQFYAVFAYDTLGNSSSGAVVEVREKGVVIRDIEEVPPEEEAPDVRLKFRDLVFIQGGKEIGFIGDEVVLDGSQPFEVRAPYGRLPEHLKTVLVDIADHADHSKVFSFLLRINAEKTSYSAVIAPLSRIGEYPIKISILNYSQQTISSIRGNLVVEGPRMGEKNSQPAADAGNRFLDVLDNWSISVIFFLLLILVALLAMRKKRRPEDGKDTF